MNSERTTPLLPFTNNSRTLTLTLSHPLHYRPQIRLFSKMDNEKISDFLSEQRDAAPDSLQHYFLSFEDYWERKLWHELTDILVQFYNESGSAGQRIGIYNNFIKTFADKINQLKLVTIGLSTASQYKGK